MPRWFAIMGHRATSKGEISLNDLPGSGRVDVLARAVSSALFVSHGIRSESNVILHLLGGEGPPRRVWFDGSRLKGVRPDERSISGQIKAIVKMQLPPRGRFEEVSKGILHSGGGLDQTLSEWRSQGVEPVVLDASGEPYSSIGDMAGLGFVISDDLPFSEDEVSSLEGSKRLSLGKIWLQGHSCISILHFLMDEA